MGLIKVTGACLLLFFLVLPIGAQTASPSRLLAADLEKLEQESSKLAGKQEALKTMARLQQLSGNREKALEAWTAASNADPSKPDYEALLEVSRLLISMGEYDRAEAEFRKLSGLEDAVIDARAQLTMAQLEAFNLGDTSKLQQLAADSLFVSLRGEIYYTLWKISGAESWKNKLTAEFPDSPEARISSAAGTVKAAATPQWLLFQGFSSTEAYSAESLPSALQDNQTQQAGGILLQTGLFSREPNAKAFRERLEKAGFYSRLFRREINDNEYWAVMVDGGKDHNKTLQELKQAGFDAFPVKEPAAPLTRRE